MYQVLHSTIQELYFNKKDTRHSDVWTKYHRKLNQENVSLSNE